MLLSWPPSLESLINFIAFLSSKSYKHSTASSYVSGISFFLKVNSWPDITEAFIVRKMLKGLRNKSPSKDTRLPITLEMLKKFPNALKNVTSSKYEALLFSTAFSIAFFGFLRVGEIAALSKSSNTSRIIQVSDVVFASDEVLITVHFSKTDQSGKSVTLQFTRCCSKQICPVTLIEKYMLQRPKVQGPLFCHLNGGPMTRYQFSAMLSKALKFLKLESPFIRSHSFRIGAATVASSQNIDDSEIKKMGRWSDLSLVYKRYIRLDKIQA